jgi:uncharacterized 2Fe-2S/4Fe-4S cluster protein (DUF4445 family)
MYLKVIKGSVTYSINCDEHKTVLQNLIENNIKISSPCNGHGSCGKCKFKLEEGEVYSKIHEENINLEENEYLACRAYCKRDCTIILPEIEDRNYSILENFKWDKIKVNPEYKKIPIDIDEDFSKARSLTGVINQKLHTNMSFSFKALKKLSTLINESSKKQNEYCIYGSKKIWMTCSDDRVIDVFKTEKEADIYGIAVDIGTTTIAMNIIEIFTGKIIGSTSVLNSQRQFGADVISRIQYSMENGMYYISRAVKDDIIEGVEKLIEDSNVDSNNVYKIAISANNIMIHLLLGLFCDSMAFYPFTSVVNDLVQVDFNELFRNRLLDCKVHILPSISSYIGADILSGIIACNFYNSDEICMLIDIGTNGEMVIGNKDRILCMSTAAGPAFEGANIENGVGSVDGAISHVEINENFQQDKSGYKINYSTIGDNSPIGICGSGIIDLTAEMLKNGIIDKSGKFNESKSKNNYINITKDDPNNKRIIFTQKDVREVQMAKSAIRAGIEILVNKFGCSYNQISKVYMAGGFGNGIDINNASTIGIIPKSFLNKVEFIGNSSMFGTVEYLTNKNTKTNMNHIIDIVETVDISLDDEFNEKFISNISF